MIVIDQLERQSTWDYMAVEEVHDHVDNDVVDESY